MVKSIKNSIKESPESRFIGQGLPEFLQAPGILAMGNPQLEVAPVVIFLVHVLHQAAVLALTVQTRLILHAVLQGAADDGFAVDDAVSLGNDAAIDGARLMSARSTMILGSIGNGVDFVIVEPMAQPFILTHDAGTVDVVFITSKCQSQVMVSRCNKQQAAIHLGIILGQ